MRLGHVDGRSEWSAWGNVYMCAAHFTAIFYTSEVIIKRLACTKYEGFARAHAESIDGFRFKLNHMDADYVKPSHETTGCPIHRLYHHLGIYSDRSRLRYNVIGSVCMASCVALCNW